MAKADADQDGLAAARYLTETERQQRVDELGNQRRAWRLDAVRDAMQAVPDELQTEVWIFPPFVSHLFAFPLSFPFVFPFKHTDFCRLILVLLAFYFVHKFFFHF